MEETSICSVNTKYIPLKVAYFTLFAGMASLWNFISLHMKSLGLSASEIGIINGIPQFLGSISTILAGAIADRFRIHSLLSGSLTIIVAFVQLLLFLIPKATNETAVDSLNCDLNRTSDSTFINTTYFPSNITSSPENISFPVYFLIDSVSSINYDIPQFCLVNCCDSQLYLDCQTFLSEQEKKDASSIHWTCEANSNTTSSSLNDTLCIQQTLHMNQGIVLGICDKNTSTERFTISTQCQNSDHNFEMTCGKPTLSGMSPVHENYSTTFWMYFGIYGIASFIMFPIWPLLNAIAYSLLGNQRNSWGKNRVWGTISDGLVVFPLSVAMHVIGTQNQPSFIPNFVVYFVFTLSSGVIICCLKGQVPVNEKSTVWKDLKVILKIWETYILLILTFLFGLYLSVISTIMPLYVTKFPNGNEMVFALSIVANIIGEIPMLFFAKRIIDTFGYIRCLYLACAAFTIRFFLYTIITNPWWILPINLLHGITFGVMYSSVTAYASSLTPPALHGTMQGLVHTFTWSLGNGSGGIISGKMMDQIGAKETFAIFSACALGTLVLYFAYVNILVYTCSWGKSITNRDLRMTTPESTLNSDSTDSKRLLLGSDDEEDSSLSDEHEGSY